MAKFLKFKASQTGEGERDLLVGLDNLAAIEIGVNSITLTYGKSSAGNDVLNLFYLDASLTSPQQMRNFFQDKMIQAQNANATSLVLDIIPPIEINNYYVN
jgi:hypothetical protein|tara:strand:- start:52 stop:354 length:303 start_codon:yes stop_codon:yes gene_type:complete